MPSTYVLRFANNPVRPAFDPKQARMEAIRLNPSTNFARGQVLGEMIGANALVQATAASSTNTFTVTYGGQTTGNMTSGTSTYAQLQTALNGLSSIGTINGSVNVQVNPPVGKTSASVIAASDVYTLTFQNQLGYQSITIPTTTGTGASVAAFGSGSTNGSAGTPGQFNVYNPTNADGSQTPRAILPVACSTDSSGNITFGGQNQIETITLNATGGTFTISYGGQTTAAIAYNATAATLQAALQNITTVSVGNVSVAVSGALNGSQVYTLTFTNTLGNQSLTAVTTGVGSLTGGAATATVLTTIVGGGQSTTGDEFGQAYIVTDAYFSGTFNTADIAALTDQIVTAFGGRYVKGTIFGGGVFRIP